MSQVILYLLTELTRKLRELMFASGAQKMALKRKAEDGAFGFRLDEPDAKREAFARSRLPTLVNVDGSGQCIAVLTSGGDAQASFVCQEGSTQELPVPTCKALSPDFHPSSMYWVDVDGGSHANVFKVFCEMETDGGGWTLVWSYTFTEYENFTADANAITPRPDWQAGSDANVPVSTTPPANEIDYNAIEFSVWRKFGKEFLIKSNINNWRICSPDTGSVVEWKTGDVTCKIAKHVADTCSNDKLLPWKLTDGGYCGPALLSGGVGGQYYYFDGFTARGMPAHQPCNKGEDNGLRNVENSHGNIFVR